MPPFLKGMKIVHRAQASWGVGHVLAVSDDPSPASGDLPSGELPSGQLPGGQPEHESERAIKLVRKKTRRPDDRAGIPEPVPVRRRQHARVPYVTPVLLMSATGSEIEARSEEISEDGMLLLTPLAFPLGAALQLRFASPTTGEMITIEGAVRWLREARGRSVMGVEFVDMPAVLRRVVADYVMMLQAAHS